MASCNLDLSKLFTVVIVILLVLCLTLENEKPLLIKPYGYLSARQKNRTGLKSGLRATPPKTTDVLLCPEHPPKLEPKVDAELRIKELERNSSILQNVRPGGTYIPRTCQSRERLALIVPYRDRPEQLKVFLPYMHAFLQKQQLHYTIFVAEMTQGTIFNTGLLQNVGFATAAKMDNFTCFVINDVDLVPTNENNLYRCADVPKHLCHSNSKYNYKLIYDTYFGGAVAVTGEQFRKINGYSNLYFGFGSQDDDFAARIQHIGYKWVRVPKDVGVYYHTFSPHGDIGNPINPNRASLYATAAKRMGYEGLNSLRYKQVALELRDLYTWVLVDVNQTEVTKDYADILPNKFVDLKNLTKSMT